MGKAGHSSRTIKALNEKLLALNSLLIIIFLHTSCSQAASTAFRSNSNALTFGSRASWGHESSMIFNPQSSLDSKQDHRVVMLRKATAKREPNNQRTSCLVVVGFEVGFKF